MRLDVMSNSSSKLWVNRMLRMELMENYISTMNMTIKFKIRKLYYFRGVILK